MRVEDKCSDDDDDDDASAVSDARRAGFHVDRIRSRVRYV